MMNDPYILTHRKIRSIFHTSCRNDNLPIVPTNPKISHRNTLADLFGALQFKNVAEIGVWRGDYSLELLQRNPNCHLYCIDPWVPYENTFRKTVEIQDKFFADMQNNLRHYINTGRVTIIRKHSIDALNNIEDNSLDVIYIDGDHRFNYVMLDLIYYSQKVKRGGIVALHDYCHMKNGGVVYAVNAFTSAHNINPWFVTKEVCPTAFWVKQ